MDELPSLIEALPDSPLRDVLWKMYERLVGLERREDERLEAPQPAAEPTPEPIATLVKGVKTFMELEDLAEISRRARELKPEVLADALQERVHQEYVPPAAEPARCAFCGEAEPPGGPLDHSCAASEQALVELREKTFAEPALQDRMHKDLPETRAGVSAREAACKTCGSTGPGDDQGPCPDCNGLFGFSA